MKILIIYELNKFQKIFYNLFYIMKFSVEKFYKDFEKNSLLYSFLIIILILGIYYYYNYINKKSNAGYEGNTSSPNNAYSNQKSSQNTLPQASQPLGQNEVYSSVNFNKNTMPMTNCNTSQNPSDLLPKDSNSNWASLNPQGKGDLTEINLLKAGHHLGIDTIGQTLKNANLQIRSEPPNPQLNTGPWNQSTITPDFMRPPLEIGCGSQ
jgi:hypothetical protein